jgi:hypothetical protein
MTENTIENSERGDKARDLLSAIDDYASRHFSTGVMHARGQEGGASTWADQRRALAAMLDELQREAYAEGRKDEAETLSQAARDVLNERQRQISAEGWTPKHDDTHGKGEMAAAAACYANPIRKYLDPRCTDVIGWPKGWGYKPKDRRSNLVRAAALLIAEIERLDRAVAA